MGLLGKSGAYGMRFFFIFVLDWVCFFLWFFEFFYFLVVTC